MSSEVKHIPLLQRKQVAAKCLYFEGSQPLKDQFAEAGRPDFEKLDGYFRSEVSTVSADTERLDSFLDGTFKKVWALGRVSFPGSQVLAAIEKGIAPLSCTACPGTGTAKRVCDGSWSDSQIVANDGLCVAPLRNLFGLASGIADAYYSKWGLISYGKPSIGFATDFLDPADGLDANRFHVNGATGLDGNDCAIVVLRINPDGFNWEALLATLYVLVHEIVAHAYSGISPCPAGRQVTAPKDEFAEGWMDFVAFMMLDEALKGTGPAKNLTQKLIYPNERLDMASRFHLVRAGMTDSQDARQRARGRSGAQKMLSLLRTFVEADSEAKGDFFRMSLTLNMLLSISNFTKSLFASRVNALIPSYKPVSQSFDTRFAGLSGAVLAFCESHDVSDLVSKVLGMK